METTIFLDIIENEYKGMISSANRKYRDLEPSTESVTMDVSLDDVTRFKEWLTFALKATEVTSSGNKVNPMDVIVNAAIKTSPNPPYTPQRPGIIKVLSLFTEDELSEIFGSSRAYVVRKLIDEA